MPLTPPALEALPRFDPIFVTQEDLEDLATFFGMTHKECLDRLRQYSMREMADAWRRADPQTPDQILDFYRKTDLYIWELMQWHASAARIPCWQALARLADRYLPAAGYLRVYDFGCGVGTDGLFLASRGYEVTLVDVDGPAFRFATHRFRRRGLAASFQVSCSPNPEPGGVYDVVVCFDVFEHLPDPLNAARRLVAAMRIGGLLVQRGAFEDSGDHPCHLHDGVERFGGLRWHIHLTGLGLRPDGPLAYRKAEGLTWLTQKCRYAIWRRTSVWINYVRPA